VRRISITCPICARVVNQIKGERYRRHTRRWRIKGDRRGDVCFASGKTIKELDASLASYYGLANRAGEGKP
jgi:hypothetical protein